MSAFGAMDIARSGVGLSHVWMDTIAHNLANVNTTTGTDEAPFRAHRVVARSAADGSGTGRGVAVTGIRESAAEASVVHDPTHPLADEDGLVQAAAVDLSVEMTDLVIANRTYQANLRTIESAHDAYRSALQIGRR